MSILDFRKLLFAGVVAISGLLWAVDDGERSLGYSRGAFYKEVIRVVDQNGAAVANALLYAGDGGGKPIFLYSDVDGRCVLEGVCRDRLHYQVVKDGYYRGEGEIRFLDSTSYPLVVNGRWQPYGLTHDVVLNQIKKPVSLTSHWRKMLPIHKQGEWVGFDLEKFDWVTPYGKGLEADMMLRISNCVSNYTGNYSAVMDVSFTNVPFAGFYVAKKNLCSDLKTGYRADTNARLSASCTFKLIKHPGHKMVDSRLAENEYLVFRTRTKTDAQGNLISSHYGMIVGQWDFLGGLQVKACYFNPECNDSNLEDEETVRLTRLSTKRICELYHP